MTRRLIHESAFAVFIVALLLALGAAAGLIVFGPAAWPALAWSIAVTAAAWLVGWFTIPRPPALGTCPQCRGFIWLPTAGADVSSVKSCKACDGGAMS